MQADEDAGELPELTEALALGVLNLMLLTELQMRLGLDPDGSHTLDRARSIIGAGLQLDPVVRIRPGGDGSRRRALRSLAAYLRTIAPLVTRIIRRPAG